MNAIVLGIVVFKALKRSNPIIFSEYLVYELDKHRFWVRFINIDADQLREAHVQIEFVQFAGGDLVETAYDTQTNSVETDVKQVSVLPRLRLMAIRFTSNEGQYSPARGDFTPLVLAPWHFSGSTGKYLQTTIRGYCESTGDLFFYSKRYSVKDVRCGRFDDVDNNKLQGESDRTKSRYLAPIFNRTISTRKEACLRCPYHAKCEFDVAVKSRADLV